jgi:hypothetical protein
MNEKIIVFLLKNHNLNFNIIFKKLDSIFFKMLFFVVFFGFSFVFLCMGFSVESTIYKCLSLFFLCFSINEFVSIAKIINLIKKMFSKKDKIINDFILSYIVFGLKKRLTNKYKNTEYFISAFSFLKYKNSYGLIKPIKNKFILDCFLRFIIENKKDIPLTEFNLVFEIIEVKKFEYSIVFHYNTNLEMLTKSLKLLKTEKEKEHLELKIKSFS